MTPRLRRPALRRPAPGPWLPNGFTMANLGFGIYAILSASHGNFETAVRCIVFGGVADLFDGAVARATRTGSELGEQLDSLVDAISFGLAPAMIVYYAVPLPQQGWGWAPVFIYAATAVFRLARFNVTQAGASKTYFIGLPSPAAGGTLATYYWFTQTTLYNQTRIIDLPWQEIMRYLMILLAFLMISPVPYPAWPKVGIRSWRGILGLLLVLGIVLGATLYSKYFFFLFGLSYVAYGLVRAVVLALIDRPPDGVQRRRSTDYIDPMESYGMHTGEHTRHSVDDVDDESDEEDATEESDRAVRAGARADGHGTRRRKRRRRPRPGTPPPPNAPPNA